MQRQSLEKIVINVGVGKMRGNSAQFEDKTLPEILKQVTTITGQKPAVRTAKKSIASFKLREGEVVGIQVTLRGKRMQDFLTKLANVALPRVRDFHGLSLKQLDGQGNLSIGLKDCIVFPEIDPETVKANFGIQITLVGSFPNQKDKEAILNFWKSIGIPFVK